VLSPDIRDTFHLSNAGIDAVASLTAAVPIVFAVVLVTSATARTG